MTNKQLIDFENRLSKELKVKKNNNTYIINEAKQTSQIRKISIEKGNNELCIIKQIENECNSVKGFFCDNLKSCDFIAIKITKQLPKIFFCEIKSSKSDENIEQALKQVKTSKIFFEFLIKSYAFHYNENFHMDLNEVKNIYIYPYRSAPKRSKTQKEKLSNKDFDFIEVEADNNGNISIKANGLFN